MTDFVIFVVIAGYFLNCMFYMMYKDGIQDKRNFLFWLRTTSVFIPGGLLFLYVLQLFALLIGLVILLPFTIIGYILESITSKLDA